MILPRLGRAAISLFAAAMPATSSPCSPPITTASGPGRPESSTCTGVAVSLPFISMNWRDDSSAAGAGSASPAMIAQRVSALMSRFKCVRLRAVFDGVVPGKQYDCSIAFSPFCREALRRCSGSRGRVFLILPAAVNWIILCPRWPGSVGEGAATQSTIDYCQPLRTFMTNTVPARSSVTLLAMMIGQAASSSP